VPEGLFRQRLPFLVRKVYAEMLAGTIAIQDCMMPQGEPALTIRCLILPLTVATIVTMPQCEVLAQTTPPAQAGQTNDSVFPPVSNPPTANLGTSPIDRFQAPPVPAECIKEFAPLRDEAEKRGRLIREAAARHAAPREACMLIRSYGEAEIKLIKYLKSHATTCARLSPIASQLENAHNNNEVLHKRICMLAQQASEHDVSESISEILNPKPPPWPAGALGDF
jgi:hypothetical protein